MIDFDMCRNFVNECSAAEVSAPFSIHFFRPNPTHVFPTLKWIHMSRDMSMSSDLVLLALASFTSYLCQQFLTSRDVRKQVM